MHYHLSLAKNYLGEPSKFVKTALNLARSPFVDTFIVSWPKAGRTWLRVMLGRVIILCAGCEERLLLDTYALTKLMKCDRVLFTHAGKFHLPDTRRLEQMVFKERPYSRCKVLFLVRDVRDVLVSHYFHESKRTGVFRGNIHDFVRDEALGIRKIITYYNLWFRNQDRPRAFRLLRYEDMHAAPEKQLRCALDFIGLAEIPDETVRAAVEFATFENMKRLEASGNYKDSMLQSRSSKDREAFKVRRGRIGGHVDYLDECDLEYIQDVIEDLRIPGCDWYYSASLPRCNHP